VEKATEKKIALFLNEMLRVRKIRDASVNGLQMKSRKTGPIKTVGFAVDACMATFEKAKERSVDLLVVHHGILWRPRKDRELENKRIAWLKKNNMALYAAHLPLDLHEEYGNNAQLARLLDVQQLRKFGRYHGVKIGYAGKFKTSKNLHSITSRLSGTLRTDCDLYSFGKKCVRSIGIVSGGGGSMLVDAVQEGLDCFLVGEIDLGVYNAAKEHGINLIVGGHYATETVGVKSLMPLLERTFDVSTVFISDPKKL